MNKHWIKIIVLGFLNGFILPIAGATLNFVLSENQINITIIGLFSLLAIPYAIKPILALAVDFIHLPILEDKLGSRLSWFLLIHVCLTLSVFYLSFLIKDTRTITIIALVGFLISLFGACQDVIVNVIKIEIIPPNLYGYFSGIYITGYRLGMTCSGAIAVYFSQYIGWGNIYKIFGIICMILGWLVCMLISNEQRILNENKVDLNPNLQSLFSNPLRALGYNMRDFIYILAFLILYRIPDDLISAMMNSFLLNLGFSVVEIASAGKLGGLLFSTLGSLYASYLLRRWKLSIMNSLLLFGAIHAAIHLLLVALSIIGYSKSLFIFTTACEGITNGFSMTVYLAFIGHLCKENYKSSKYAMFTTMMGISRAVGGSISGFMVNLLGWQVFFLSVIFISSFGLVILHYKIRKMKFLIC